MKLCMSFEHSPIISWKCCVNKKKNLLLYCSVKKRVASRSNFLYEELLCYYYSERGLQKEVFWSCVTHFNIWGSVHPHLDCATTRKRQESTRVCTTDEQSWRDCVTPTVWVTPTCRSSAVTRFSTLLKQKMPFYSITRQFATSRLSIKSIFALVKS